MKTDRPIRCWRYARPRAQPSQRCAPHRKTWLLCLLAGLVLTCGCRSTGWVQRREPRGSLRRYLPHAAVHLPPLSARTMLLLRTHDLTKELEGNPDRLLTHFSELMQREPSAEKLFAYSEIAHRAARHFEPRDDKKAFDLYITSVTHAYLYLFDERYQSIRNIYDPQFRGACDLYNRSLGRALRIVSKHRGLQPGLQHICQVRDGPLDIRIETRCDHLSEHEFEKFEFASDYELNGLPNRYVDYGLGVALIAKRKHRGEQSPIEPYYPQGLSIPLTAFLRILPHEPGDQGSGPARAILELYDPLATRDIRVAGRQVPLETDLTTPLAYFLNNLDYTDLGAATRELFRPGQSSHRTGLQMLEPYQPDKIPVVLVHGIWSTPITWVRMFNDLRSIPAIRQNYQFWFYFYPTGQPFVLSAAQLRDELAEIRGLLDPQRRQPALDRLVLIGHSMGGLISRLQTVDSGNLFWDQVARQPLDKLETDERTLRSLQQTYFFHPNPSVRRVITIATPHHGSSYSNATTRWLGRKFIDIPPVINGLAKQLHLQDPDALRDEGVHLTRTSIDSLAPDSPALKALRQSRRASWVVYHNIVAKAPKGRLLGRFVGDSDGVVDVASAQTNDAASQILVEADHQTAHRHPRTVLEVRSILLEHLTPQPDISPASFPVLR
jgi:pimeloyl-ACP methyl ester carboxylesterase